MLAADGGVRPPPGPTLASDTPVDVEMTLLNPGDKPRRPLRVALSVGASSPSKITVKAGVTAKPAKKRLPRPKMEEATGVCAIEVVAPSGKAELTLRCPEADPMSVPLATRGALKTPELDGKPREAWLQAQAQVLLGAAPLLPEEPVGKGAIWMVTVSESTFGLPRRRTIKYELEALDGNHAKIAWTEGAQTTPHRLREPSAWARSDLVGYELVGDGEVELDVGAAPVATRGHGTRSEWVKIRSFQGPRSVFMDVVTVTGFALGEP
jgi:hypothetical protein